MIKKSRNKPGGILPMNTAIPDPALFANRKFMINEDDVLCDVKNLDRQAIGQIYDKYFSEVYRYVLYRMGDASLAEDIAGDVFLQLVEAAQTGKGPKTNLKAWLMATATHMVADQFRRKYRRPQEVISDELADTTLQPAAEVDQREQNHLVETAYQTLTAEQQEVIALRFGQGYSLDETASIMKRNVNAVKALQFRALSTLSREIGEVDHE
jgi:RNA polymerase sigma-70 factor (ECF subfamily)